jgi:chromosome segregation ATPase
MRSRWTILAAVAATCWVAPQLAVAEDDVEAQLRQMNERMQQMQQQLQATNEELAASKQQVSEQQGLIQDLDADREASSALSKFLSETEFSGLVAASYTYNFKNFSSPRWVQRNSTVAGENGSFFGIVRRTTRTRTISRSTSSRSA